MRSQGYFRFTWHTGGRSTPFVPVTLLLGDTSTEVLFRAPTRVSTLVLHIGGTCSPPSGGRSCTRQKLTPSKKEMKKICLSELNFFE